MGSRLPSDHQLGLPDQDARACSSSLAVGLAVTVVAGLSFWFAMGPWRGAVHATSYADLSALTKAGQLLWHGQIGALYKSDTGLLSLPLTCVAMAPLAPVLDHLHGSIYWHNAATLVAGSYVLLLGTVLLYAVRRLAWDLQVRRHLWLVQLLAAILVLVPEFEYGHVEDVLALAFVLLALRRLIRQDPVGAALLISVGVSFKQWAAMLVPLVLLSAPRGSRLRTTIAATALPGVLIVTSLALDRSSAFRAFFLPPGSNQLSGHPSFDPTWLGTHTSEASRILAVLIAIALGWRFRSLLTPTELTAAASAIFVLRPLTEPVNYSYYWSPALLLVVLVGIAADSRVKFGTVLWPLLAMAWTIPRGLNSSASSWWECELLILGVTAIVLTHKLRDIPDPVTSTNLVLIEPKYATNQSFGPRLAE